mgnify:CR=1 FL=1
MANPNLFNASSVLGKTVGLALTTANQTIVSNAASSGELYKINTLMIANVDGSQAADVTVELLKGATAYKLLNTIPIPADSSLVAISRDNQIYLEENDSIRLLASANSDLVATCSYEEIS